MNVADAWPPIVAVPIPAGHEQKWGASVIADERRKVKRIFFRARRQPSTILDPKPTVNCRRASPAATGMDALSHNLEAYCSPFFHPMAAGVALEGMPR